MHWRMLFHFVPAITVLLMMMRWPRPATYTAAASLLEVPHAALHAY